VISTGGPRSLARGVGAAAAILFLLVPLALSANANDDLLKAAAQGDARGIARALGRGARIATSDQMGRTALHLAAARGFTAAVSLLLDRGAPLGARDAEGMTALARAARSLQGDVVKLLLDRGADRRSLAALLASRDASGRTLLHTAALRGSSAVTVFCTVAGDLDPRDDAGRTPLSLAAASAGVEAGERRRGYLEAVRALLDAGADPSAADAKGFTPLWYAVHSDDGELALLLSERSVDVTAIAEAYGRGDNRIARMLTERITDATATDAGGSTYLHVAALLGLPELASRALAVLGAAAARGTLALPAEVDRLDRYGRTPLVLAVGRGDEEVARLLLDAGADPNRPGERGVTPLCLAARQGHVGVADLLISAGAVVSPPGKTTALHEAVQARHADMAGFLLSRGAEINAFDERGNTPLFYAVETRAGTPGLDLVRLLLEAGATADARRAGGETPLLAAVETGKREEAALLLSRGADPAASDAAGKSPRSAAEASGNRQMIELLRGAMAGSSR
jgi:ankyrin repeat protein